MFDTKFDLQLGSNMDYSQIPGEYFAAAIIVLILAMVLQSFAIAFERFQMDPMKRGLVNQLCTTYMLFAMCWSGARIMRCLVEWLTPRPMPTFVFKSLGWVGWIGMSSHFGCLITMNEVVFFTYWSKMWLKRVPNYTIIMTFWLPGWV